MYLNEGKYLIQNKNPKLISYSVTSKKRMNEKPVNKRDVK